MAPHSPQRQPPTLLLLIDIQKGFDEPTFWGKERSTPSFENNIAKLLAKFRHLRAQAGSDGSESESAKYHIIHVRHHSRSDIFPLHPSKPGAAFVEFAAPLPDGSEPVLTKDVNSAFIGTDLEARIRALGIRRLVIAGLTTGHCVSTTTRMAANLRVVDLPDASGSGEIILVGDATAMFSRVGVDGREFGAEELHAAELAMLNDEFCVVRSTAEVLESLQM